MATDDEYGLTPATATATAPEDEYGLEPAKKQAATATAEPPTDEEIEAAYGKDVTPKVRAALKSGVAPMQKPTKFEEDRPQIPEHYGFTLGNIAKNVAGGAAGLVKSGAQAAYDTTLGEVNPDTGELEHGLGGIVGMNTKGEFAPGERAQALTRKYITDPAVAAWDKGSEVGGIEGAGHKAAAALPVIGPWAESLGEQAGTGDVGGATGQAAGTIGAGELIPRIPALADKLVRGTPLTEAGKLAAAKEQALTVKKPSMSETEYSDKVTKALPDLQRIAQDNAGKIKNPRQAVDAINARIGQMEAPIGDHLNSIPSEVIHPDQYVGEMNSSLDQALQNAPTKLTAKEMEAAKTKVDELLENKPQSLADIEKIRRRLNTEAESYFSSKPADKRVMDASDATAIAQRAAANYLRERLYGSDAAPGWLERAGVTAVDQAGNQVPLREFRKSVGNLIEVRDHFEDAITRAEATGDWKPFQKLFSGPSVAAGGVGMIGGAAVGGPFGALLGTLTGEGLKAWGDYLRTKNPNLNVEKMFRNLENTSKPNTVDIQTRQPILQHPSGTGPTIQHAEPLGPITEPPPFEVNNQARPNPNASQLWEPQAGELPPIGFNPAAPKVEPLHPDTKWKLGNIGVGEPPDAGRALPAPATPLPLPGTAELAHPEMFPKEPMTREAQRQVYRDPESGRMQRGYTGEGKPLPIGHTAEGGDILPPITSPELARKAIGTPTPEAEASAPKGLGEIGGKGREGILGKIEATPTKVFRAHDEGSTAINPRSHAHATADIEEARRYLADREDVEGKPQQLSAIDLTAMKPEDYERFTGPNGADWIRFTRDLAPEEMKPMELPQKATKEKL